LKKANSLLSERGNAISLEENDRRSFYI